MIVVKDIAMVVALLSSMGLFLYGYFEGLALCNQEGKVRGEGVIIGFSLAMVFALIANDLVS
ncbi:hypothetical protein JOC95_004347 [Bacillus tianshenii]|uniref:Uncharacterized protein n=1 Tax=Sutcliffiella tianshenii TaxID=1463404 RepID=A0ABS2P7Q5_9BACI|nr:hypothetical protein [Bacillus tianshenii]MBM7622430.1 hypothetical protein [Bacillus tianshenii]